MPEIQIQGEGLIVLSKVRAPSLGPGKTEHPYRLFHQVHMQGEKVVPPRDLGYTYRLSIAGGEFLSKNDKD